MNIDPKLVPYTELKKFDRRFYIPNTLHVDTVLSFLGDQSKAPLDESLMAPKKFEAYVYPRKHIDNIETFIEENFDVTLFSTIIIEGPQVYVAKHILSQVQAEIMVGKGIRKFMELVQKKHGKAYMFTDNVLLNEQVFYTV